MSQGRIPRHFIDELLARTDIVELIDSRVPLKKAGANHMACCPFHQEKSPSFSVNASKQFYYCFGCGATGNALSFLMEYDRLEFVAAIEELASRYGLTIPYEGQAPQQEYSRLYQLLGLAAQYFQQQFHRTSSVQSYVERRGLNASILNEFQLGYAPASWDSLLNYLESEGFQRHELAQAGLVIENEQGRHYDRFRDRLMFPIRDKRGRTLGFGGRILGEGTPKYLNSPETPVFHKGQELYGLYEARQQHTKLDFLLIVEGYMDVIALAQQGISQAVATLGTATTTHQLTALLKQSRKLIFCFDGDRAGKAAAWRALENALPLLAEQGSLHFLFLPDGEDPDSLVRHEGAKAFLERLQQAQGLADFLFDSLQQQVSSQGMQASLELVQKATPLLEKIPKGLYRELLLDALALRAKIDRRQLNRLNSGKPLLERPKRQAFSPNHKALQPTPMRIAIAMLLQQPQLARHQILPEAVQHSQQPGADLLRRLHTQLQHQPELSTGQLLEHWQQHSPDEAQLLARLAAWPHPVPESGMQAELLAALNRLEQEAFSQELQQLKQKLQQQSLLPAEHERLKTLLKLIHQRH